MWLCVCLTVRTFASSLSLCRYWGRSKETADAFTADGWFKTGDIAGKLSNVTSTVILSCIVTCFNQFIDQAGTLSLVGHQQTS